MRSNLVSIRACTAVASVLLFMAMATPCVAAGAAGQSPIVKVKSSPRAFPGEPMILDASESYDVDGDALEYEWVLASAPQGSEARLVSPRAGRATFTPDVPGAYEFQVTVRDRTGSIASKAVLVSTLNAAPVAHAGSDQTVRMGANAQLDGSRSTDVDGDQLNYQWLLRTRPSDSRAAIENADPTSPLADFPIDVPGEYVAELRVHDGREESEPDIVVIASANSAPLADAGPDRTVALGDQTLLSGIQSSDPDADTLTYQWRLSTPAGSRAALSASQSSDTSFVADAPGEYVAQLRVADGTTISAPDTVVISTTNSAPQAKPEPDLRAVVGDSVTLDGASSSDPDDDPLSFEWALISKPVGSRSALSETDKPTAVLIPDIEGLYIAQLIVDDGPVSSMPETMRITVQVGPAGSMPRPSPVPSTASDNIGNSRTANDDARTVAPPAKVSVKRGPSRLIGAAVLDLSLASADFPIDESDVASVRDPQWVTSPDGRVTALWSYQTFPAQYYTRSYTPGGGWGASLAIPTPWAGSASSSAIRLADVDGALFAVWIAGTPNPGTYGSRYVPGTGWSAATQLSPNTASLIDVNLAAASANYAAATWAIQVGSSSEVYATAFGGGSWTTAARVGSSLGNATTVPELAVDQNGNAFMTWVRAGSPADQHVVVRFDRSSATWIAVHSQETNTATLAANRFGDTVFAWVVAGRIHARRWSATDPHSQLVNAEGDPFELSAAVDDGGNALLAWGAATGSIKIFAQHYAVGQGWESSATQVVDTFAPSNGDDRVRNIAAALHGNGRASVSWQQQNGGQFSFWASLRSAGQSGWPLPHAVEQVYQSSIEWPSLKLADADTLWALWAGSKPDDSQVYDLYLQQFEWPATGAPTQPPPPRARAGQMQSVVEDQIVTLDASASVGAIASYSWTQVAGPSVTLTGANTATPQFVAALPGTHPNNSDDYDLWFQLTVGDAAGNSSSDLVCVRVLSLPTPQFIMVEPKNGAARIVWSSVSTTRFNLYWSPTPGVPLTSAHRISNASRPYLHTGLNDGSTYYYRVTAVYSGPSGDAESAPTIEVSATPGEQSSGGFWEEPVPVSISSDGEDYAMATDDHGNAFLISAASGDVLRVTRYTPASGWSLPTVITPGAEAARDVAIAVSGNGETALAAWNDFATVNGSSQLVIYASRWTSANGWEPHAAVAQIAGESTLLNLEMDAGGNAILVFKQYIGGIRTIHARRNSAANGWEASVQIGSASSTPSPAALAMSASGDAVLTWNASDGWYVTRFESEAGWRVPVKLGSALQSSASINDSGDAMVMWRRSTTHAVSSLFWRRLADVPEAVQLVPGAVANDNLRVVLNRDRSAVATWMQDNVNDSSAAIRTAKWSEASGWSDVAGPQSVPNAALSVALDRDPTGRGFWLWAQQDQSKNLYAARLGADHALGASTIVDAQAIDDVPDPDLSVTRLGAAIAIWLRDNNALWSSRYVPSPAELRVIANAGADQVVKQGDSVTLRGSALVPAGRAIASYSWRQIAGPSVVLSDAAAAQPSFIAPPVSGDGLIAFELIATDSQNDTDSDTAVFKLKNATQVSLSAAPLQSPVNRAVRFNAAVAGVPAPTGSVALLENGVQFATGTLANGAVSISNSTLALGQHTIVAHYGGSDLYAPANSEPVSVTINDAPYARITAPTADQQLVAPASLVVTMSASATVGVITKVEILDGETVISSKDVPAPGTSSATLSLTIQNPSLGVHVFTARGTDARGLSNRSVPVTVTILSRPTLNLLSPAPGTFLLAPATVILQAAAANTNGGISKIEFLTGSTLRATATAPPYIAYWNNVPSGTYSVTARVTDSTGTTATSTAAAVTVGAAPTVTVSSPANNATVNSDLIASLRGTVQAPPNSAVTVNGLPAVLMADGSFFANNVPLNAVGNNTITVIVTTPDGQTVTRSLVVRRAGTVPAFQFMVSPPQGIAPLQVSLNVTNPGDVAFKRIEYSCTNTTVDVTVTTLEPAICTYPQAGSFTAKVTVIGQQTGQPETVLFTATQGIGVVSLLTQDLALRGVFLGMINRLRVGNIEGALTSVTGTTRSKYRALFNALPDRITAADQIGSIAGGTIGPGFAEYVILRNGVDGQDGFVVYLIKGDDGIWRIDSM